MKNLRPKLVATVLLSCLIVLLPFALEKYHWFPYGVEFGVSGLLAVMFAGLLLFIKRDGMVLTTTDLCVVAFLLYGLINILILNPAVDSGKWAEWQIMVLIYMLIRTVKPDANILLGAVVLSGLTQSVYGVLQGHHFFPSNHSLFEAMGSFRNPGPYGGYLAVSAVLGIVSLLSGQNPFRLSGKIRKLPILHGCCTIPVILYALFLSDSRAGWLAAVIPVCVILMQRIGKPATRRLAYLTTGAACLIGIFALYGYRKGSADARLFIWKTSSSLVVQKPVTGHGVATFPEQYMPAQAEYFRQHPDTPEAVPAANNSHAFNEYLRVACEQGLIGLALLIALFMSALFTPTKGNAGTKAARYGLISLLVFSFFSYPSEILPLKVMFPVFFALLPGRTIKTFSFGNSVKRYRFSLSAFLFALFIINLHTLNFHYRVYDVLDRLCFEGDEQAESELWEIYPKIRNDRQHILRYAKILFTDGHYGEALPVLIRASEMAPSSEVMCDLGITYQKLKRYGEAEVCFKEAACMTPGYITPWHNFFLLYRETGDQSRAMETARRIAAMKVKIENHTTKRIKREAEGYIREGDL